MLYVTTMRRKINEKCQPCIVLMFAKINFALVPSSTVKGWLTKLSIGLADYQLTC